MRQPQSRRTFLSTAGSLFGALIALLVPARSSSAATTSPDRSPVQTPKPLQSFYSYDINPPHRMTISYYDKEGNFLHSMEVDPRSYPWPRQ
jgi:hypothetical protein